MKQRDQPPIELSYGDVKATVLTEHGAFVSQLSMNNTEILVTDPHARPSLGVPLRSGIPLLFPNSGTLDIAQQRKHATQLAPHGFARFARWDTVAVSDNELRLSLASNAERLGMYPYQFRCDYQISLSDRGIRFALDVVNEDSEPLPVAPGWHPYFTCLSQNKSKTEIYSGDPLRLITDSNQFTDDLEFDFGIPTDGQSEFTLVIADLQAVKLTTSSNLGHLQCWSLPGADFVCIEPWAGSPGAMLKGTRYCIAPGKAETYWFQLAI